MLLFIHFIKICLNNSLFPFNIVRGGCIHKPLSRGANSIWPQQTAPIKNTSSKEALRIVLCWTKNTFAAAFTSQEQWEAAFLLLAEPWYSRHILVESFWEEPSKPGRGEWRGEKKKRRIACLYCCICRGIAEEEEEEEEEEAVGGMLWMTEAAEQLSETNKWLPCSRSKRACFWRER